MIAITASPRVIVHADDFGLHPALNSGIAQAHLHGIVTSASMMPLGSAFEDAVLRSRELPYLDLGLHFALVGVPGAPPTLSLFLAEFLCRRLRPSAIESSLRHQIEACCSQGLNLTHIDSHQHLHAMPIIMRIVSMVAKEYGISNIRLPLEGATYAPVPPGRRAQAAALSAMSRLSQRILAASGLRTTDHFSGMAVSGHLTAPTLAAYLQNARPGTTEIVCHPGRDNLLLARTFRWGYDWEGELAALCDPKVKTIADENQTQLIGWSALNTNSS